MIVTNKDRKKEYRLIIELPDSIPMSNNLLLSWSVLKKFRSLLERFEFLTGIWSNKIKINLEPSITFTTSVGRYILVRTIKNNIWRLLIIVQRLIGEDEFAALDIPDHTAVTPTKILTTVANELELSFDKDVVEDAEEADDVSDDFEEL